MNISFRKIRQNFKERVEIGYNNQFVSTTLNTEIYSNEFNRISMQSITVAWINGNSRNQFANFTIINTLTANSINIWLRRNRSFLDTFTRKLIIFYGGKPCERFVKTWFNNKQRLNNCPAEKTICTKQLPFNCTDEQRGKKLVGIN